MEPSKKVLTEYFSNHRILIADSNVSSRTGLAKAIVELGARTHQMTLVDSYVWAEQIIEQSRPSMIITDFNLGPTGAFDLFSHPNYASIPMQERLSVVVTSNTSQAAVAQAAEGDVDIYIAKPYSLENFWSAMRIAAATKLQPSEYLMAIEDGKKLLSNSDLGRATEVFARATSLDGKPSLAYFYCGYTQALGNALEDAQMSFRKGLEYSKNHYKCLLGLYDALMTQKRSNDAYIVLRQIARHFPLNLNRFRSVLRLAITTGHYEDIEQYYQIFLEFEEKTDEVVKHICAALITAGKYYLSKGEPEKATIILQKAGITAAGKTLFLSEIISTLVSANLADEADKYLKRFPRDMRETTEFLCMDYLVMSKTLPLQMTLDQGRKLVLEGKFHPLIDKILVETMLKAGLSNTAEFLAQDAARRWPEQASAFFQMIEVS